MTLETLNKDVLQSTLNSLRYSSTAPAEMLDIRLLDDVLDRPTLARMVILYDRLCDVTTARLQFYRQSVGVLDEIRVNTRDEIVMSIARDFAHNPPLELRNWSALYHRYFTPITYTSMELAQLVGLCRRQFDRHIHGGLEGLLRVLVRYEMGYVPFSVPEF